MKSLGREFILGIFWSLLGNTGLIIITFLTNIIIALKLNPVEFGQIAIVMFFIILVNVVAKGGMGGALIRSKNVSNKDYSTLFVFNIVLAVLGSFLLITFSNPIAKYYGNEDIKLLLRLCSLLPILNAMYFVNFTKMTRELAFKKLNIYQFISLLTSSVCGIILAFKGFGSLALIAIQLVNSLLLIFFLSLEYGFYFNYKFSLNSFKRLFSFGINTTLVNLLNTGFDNIYSLVIGKSFNVFQVGFYYQAKKLQQVPTEFINSLSQKVVFASLSKIQDDSVRFNRLYLKIISILTVTTALIVFIIYSYSDLVIATLYDEKWLDTIPYLKLLVLSTFFYILEQFNRIIFKIYNKTGKLLKLELLKKIIQIFSIVIGVYLKNLEILLMGLILVYLISYIINLASSRAILEISMFKELKLVSVVMFITISIYLLINYWEGTLQLFGFERLILLPVGIIIYLFAVHYAGIVNWKKDYNLIKNML